MNTLELKELDFLFESGEEVALESEGFVGGYGWRRQEYVAQMLFLLDEEETIVSYFAVR